MSRMGFRGIFRFQCFIMPQLQTLTFNLKIMSAFLRRSGTALLVLWSTERYLEIWNCFLDLLQLLTRVLNLVTSLGVLLEHQVK